MQFNIKSYKTLFFKYMIWLCALAMLSVIGVYSYLGTYSRYLADDYCEAVRINRSSPVSAVVDRYMAGDWRAANRYSNLLFVGFSEMLGPKNMQITIASMVLLWAIGLTWSVHEFRKYLGIHWANPMDWFLGISLGAFCLLQAPALFQTIYWRSSMMTHFAPLVFGSFLFAFWMKQARTSLSRAIPWPVYPLVFFATFIIAGFSEPPVATMVAGLSLAMLAVWVWGAQPIKQRVLALLAWTFAGAFLGLMMMVFSPANANLVKEVTPGAIEILGDSFLFSYLFIVDSLKIFPVPSLVSMLIPFLLVWLYRQDKVSESTQIQKRLIWVIIFSIPIIMWVLIAAGFSPSVYGQGFPVARMRFLARAVMTAAIMLEGAMLGLSAQDIQFKSKSNLGQWVAIVLIIVTGFIYPLRAAAKVYENNYNRYSTHAEIWDERDALIRQAVEQGATDLVVVQIDDMDGVLEYKESNWVNRCAAEFYGLHTLSAP